MRHTDLPNKKVFEPETNKIEGKIKMERVQTPKFRACGGLKGHNDSLIPHVSANNNNTRYTVRGRGAKHFFPSGSAPGGSQPEAELVSHT